MCRRSIIYTIDMVISIIIFFIALFAAINYLYRHQITHNYVQQEAELMLNSLLSEGTPPNWTNSSIVIPGILTNNRLNKSKFIRLRDIGYNNLKTLIGIRNDYFIYLHNVDGGVAINNTCGYGHVLVMPYNCSPIKKILNMSNNIGKATGIVAIPPNISYITIYVWEP